ncbi:hypothetical protein AKO1_005727 [Acrasis kona]|uniref:Plastocyanin-like domain-containing protein n=1 Tax=Acrasis kona TaxID=1008807 RepID=A0AAW2YM41_9EUKA
MRLLNGANSRYLNLRFSNGMSFVVIGNDQGYLKHPATTNNILLTPGERADIIVDFCPYAGKGGIILVNDAPAPYPGVAGEGFTPCQQGRIMMFNVSASTGACDAEFDTAPFVNVETHNVVLAKETESVRTRDLVAYINHETGDGVPRLGVRGPDGPILYEYEEPATEFVYNSTVEIWRIFNLSPESHPIHIHISAFTIISRQGFEPKSFAANGAVNLLGNPVGPDGFETGPKDVARADPYQVLTLLVKFSHKTGRYMWHCHMLEHEENAMMRPLILEAGLTKTDPIKKPNTPVGNSAVSMAYEAVFLLAIGVATLVLL